MSKSKAKNRKSGAAVRSSERVRALAIELWEAGVAEVRISEGWSDRKKWGAMSKRTKTGMMGIAKYIQNWKRPNDPDQRPGKSPKTL